MRKLLSMTLAIIMALTLAACGGANDTTEGDDTSYLSLDINPGIEFILNEEGEVESVLPLNEDAEVVLSDLDLEGKPSDEALEAFIDAAVETGYIDVDSEENVITVTSDDEEEEEAKKAEVEGILEERAIGAAIFGGEMNEDYEELAEEHDIGVGRARLISRAIEIDGDLTFEEALDMEHGEIMTILIDEHRAQMDAFIEERQEAALETKNSMKEMAQEKVQAHRDAVENGEKNTPDLDRIREDVEADLDNIRSQYEDRIQDRRKDVEDKVTEGTSYMSVEINPGIEFILDDEGNVKSVLPLNEDAEIVISDLDLERKPSDEALEEFIDAAIETGYLDVDSDENVVTVTNDDEEEEEAKKAEVEAILEERAIGAAVFGGEMNEEYEELAEEHDIGVGRARLISRAVEFSDDLTFEDALELDQSEIMSILIDEHRTQMDTFIEERKEAALETKNSMKEMAQEKVEAHRDAVENDEKGAPDSDSIRDDVEASIEDIRSQYVSRIDEKREDAEDYIPEGTN